MSFSRIDLVKPRNNWDKITPEFPLAPRREPDEIALHRESISGFSIAATSFAADMIVKVIFVPVSPSGTGKTYNTYNEAIKLFFNLWYRENCSNDYRENLTNAIKCLIENKFLRFCTFHQSYGYEEFIEGIKSDKDGKFKVEDGIFKKIAIDALYEGLKLNLKLKIYIIITMN